MHDTAIEYSWQVLEYSKILELVRSNCRSEEGYSTMRTEKILPAELPQYTDYLQELMDYKVCLPQLARRLDTIAQRVIAAKKKKRLKPPDLLAVKRWLAFYHTVQTMLSTLPRCASLLESKLGNLDKTVLLPFTEEGIDFRKDAQLVSYEQNIRSLKKHRHNYAKQEMQKQPQLFRGNEPCLRNDRLTFPAISGARLERQTIVTDSSDSQATQYREDERLVDLNNALRVESQHIEERINELCAIASEAIAEHSDALLAAETDFSFVDRLCAKASYGIATESSVLLPGADSFVLYNARHPLLLEDFCPIHIELQSNRRVLFLSGTNGGGKSITMKTLASLVLMAHHGIPVPADAGSKMPLCTGIHCVFGDAQSIQDAHSSFTGRIERIVDICNSREKDELIILDEFGSETDPAEGAAITIALLEHLMQRRQWVCFSSHIHGCKLFAETHSEIRCASMEFKQLYNRDYYTISYDAIGASNALETAQRFGLDAGVLQHAKAVLSRDKGYSAYAEYMDAKTKLAERREFFESEIQRIQEKERALLYESAEVQASLRAELSALQGELKKLKQKTESALSVLEQEIRAANHRDSSVVQNTVKDIRSQLAAFERELSGHQKKDHTSGTKHIVPGDYITTALLREPVLVDRVAGNQKYLEVLVLGKRMRILLTEVLEVYSALESSKNEQNPFSQKKKARHKDQHDAQKDSQKEASISRGEIDLRGERVVEAVLLLERCIAQSIGNGCTELSIIHGMGTGSLRQAVQEFLQESPWIVGFRFGERTEGSHGVTIAELKHS